MKKLTIILFIAVSSAIIYSCQKWKDTTAVVDPRITARKYCNDPAAVNYNWDFPGVQDSTVCIYPVNLYEGTYSFNDSIYFEDNILDSGRILQTYNIQLVPAGKNKLLLKGYCSNDIQFTVQRNGLKAYADTTLKLDDTTFAYGQPLCRILDTLTGTIIKSTNDSTKKNLFIEWRVVSDTGINYHKGTAIKL